jgi:glycosidase
MMGKLKYMSRDNARTPMQWSKNENAGFTTANPWIKVNSNYQKINVEQQKNDPDSILNYYKQLIDLRKQNPVILYGEYKEYYGRHSTLYVYTREYKGEKIVVINSFSKKDVHFTLIDELKFDNYELLISNYQNNEKLDSNIVLKPFETRVYKVK